MKNICVISILGLTLSSSLVAAQIPENPTRGEVAHLLDRAGFGARPGDIDRVLATGVEAYIDRQLAPEAIPDDTLATFLSRLEVFDYSRSDLAGLQAQLRRARRRRAEAAAGTGMTPSVPNSLQPGQVLRRVAAELAQAAVVRAAVSERQLYEVMVDFWTNHFNVYMAKGPIRVLMPEYVESVIRPHALGNFRELLGATAASPAMLIYLDNARSVGEGSVPPQVRELRRFINGMRVRGVEPDSAVARLEEMMTGFPDGPNENYARELLELHTLGVDGGYTQEDVEEVARIFTGWSVRNRSMGFVFNRWAHDRGEKVVMGTRFTGSGMEEGERLLDMLAEHPATRRHVSTKLCVRFVSDGAPPGCVDAAVAAWEASGGEIREVVRAILSSPEFWDEFAIGSKVKTPLEFVVSAVRGLGAYPDDSFRMLRAVSRLGQPLFLQEAPTGYPEDAASWMNSGALMARVNYAMALIGGRSPGFDVDLGANFPLSAGTDSLIGTANATLLRGRGSANTLAVMRKRVEAIRDPVRARGLILGLALGSPEFQRQ